MERTGRQGRTPDASATGREQPCPRDISPSHSCSFSAPWPPPCPPSAGVLEGNCRVANQPAATLLIPYFEVDLADPAGQTTLLSVNNASSKSALARVVLWTDWGVPTLAFDVYLTGYDVQTINVRDLFTGNLPATGPDASNTGPLSDAGHALHRLRQLRRRPGSRPSSAAADVTWLRAAHTGQPVATAPAGAVRRQRRRPGPTWRPATSPSTP